MGLLRKIDDVADQAPRFEGHADLGSQDDLRVEHRRDGVVKGAIKGNFGDDASDTGHGATTISRAKPHGESEVVSS